MLLNHLMDGIIDRITSERKFKGDYNNKDLSAGARKGLIDYLAIQVHNQIIADAADSGQMPNDIKFIFGHTHTPFLENMDVNSDKYKDNRPKPYPAGYPTRFDLYNTGGWVVDTFTPEKTHGGAVVFIDDDLNAASVKMYDETDYAVVPDSTSPNSLVDRLKGMVTAGELCTGFSDIARHEVEVRRDVLKILTR
ncbi:MAG: hypothetical protein HQK95_07005 [Nitrospirae bacterium]|nr:hypothetical protein [Nitrospirota bacterium]